MSRKPKKPKSWFEDQIAEQHWLTLVALACIILFALTVIATNAVGWPKLIPGPLGWIAAALAICAGGFAFSLWEHVRRFAREKRWPNFLGALIFFVAALIIDGIGVHSGIETLAQPWVQQLEQEAAADTGKRQRELNQRRAEIAAEISAARARVAAIAPADMSGGPQNDEQERLRWNEQTASDRSIIDTKQTQLDAMARTADELPVAPWLSPAIWAFALFAELVVAFGVSILGIEIAPRLTEGRAEAPPPRPTPPTPKPVPANEPAPVTNFRPRARQRAASEAQRWSGWN